MYVNKNVLHVLEYMFSIIDYFVTVLSCRVARLGEFPPFGQLILQFLLNSKNILNVFGTYVF
jgi:hypothetical protein